MAEVEDTMPAWCGGAMIYERTNYIHEMRCGEVGSHLYSRMCCAGTFGRPLSQEGGSVWEGRRGGAGADGDEVNPLPTRHRGSKAFLLSFINCFMDFYKS